MNLLCFRLFGGGNSRGGTETVAVEIYQYSQQNDTYDADDNGGGNFVHFMLLLRLMLNFAAKVQQPHNTLSENFRLLPKISDYFRKNTTPTLYWSEWHIKKPPQAFGSWRWIPFEDY